MLGYVSVNLQEFIKNSGESVIKTLLSNFSCPYNKDVEQFLKYKAVEFARQSIANTHLVFTQYKNKPVLIGYFTLTNKFIVIYRDILSSALKKRINKFCQYDPDLKRYSLACPLIAQLGKNFVDGYDKLITGDELLKMACDKVKESQRILGGKMVYVECEDKVKLIEFYSSNGFVNFGKRKLDREEIEIMQGCYLIQMFKYLD